MDGFEKIRQNLLSTHKEVESKLKVLDEEESNFAQASPESLELGTSSWQADMESSRQAIKQRLLQSLQSIHNTLLKLKDGTYGSCEKCTKQIEKERLEIIPTANLCIACVN